MKETTTSLAPLARYLLDPKRADHDALRVLGGSLISLAKVVLPAIAVLAALVVIGLVMRASMRQRWRGSNQPDIVLNIELPPTVDARAAVMAWTNLHDLIRPRWKRFIYGQPHLAFEMVWRGPRLSFRVWVPGALPASVVERTLRAAWPGASINRTEDTNVIPAGAVAVGGRFVLLGDEGLPLATDHPIDPLRFVIGSIEGLCESQGAVVQLLCRPATSTRVDRARRHAFGESTPGFRSIVFKILDLFTPRLALAGRPAARSRDIATREILVKTSALGWETDIHYAVFDLNANATVPSLVDHVHGLASSFSVFTGPNRLARRPLRKAKEHINERRMTRAYLLSVSELAAIAHLPLDQTTSGANRAGAGTISPSPNVPTEGKVLGEADAGVRRDVAIAPADARYHLHIMGATGVGKSTLLTNLVLQDVDAGRGAVVIDPKGDLIGDIVERLSGDVLSKTMLIDPLNDAVLPSLSVLEPEPSEIETARELENTSDNQNALAIENLAGIFRQVFEAYWGPRTDDVFRTACITLVSASGGNVSPSLEDVPRLLTDAAFRKEMAKAAGGTAGVKSFWDAYELMSEAQRSQLIGPLLNKLRSFLMREFVRRATCPMNLRLDMAKILDGGLLLVRIPKGVLGDEVTRLLGSIVVAKVWQAALARSRVVGADRLDAALYVDECQNFLNLPRSFDEILAEARGYGLSLVLAHQHLGQLSRELRDGIGANARNKVWFSMSPDDARNLERYVTPEMSAHDLSNLGRYQVALRPMVDGLEVRPFTAITIVADHRNSPLLTTEIPQLPCGGEVGG